MLRDSSAVGQWHVSVHKGAKGTDIGLADVFAALAANCTKLAYLTREMAAGVEQLSPLALQSLAATLKSQSGSTGGAFKHFTLYDHFI